MIRDLFRACVAARCDLECPATQNAIDRLAAENGQDRARMLDWLTRVTAAELCDALMVAWGRAPLTLATGRPRDEWLKFFSTRRR